jgi:peptide/nickel transport system substrate-binding protein
MKSTIYHKNDIKTPGRLPMNPFIITPVFLIILFITIAFFGARIRPSGEKRGNTVVIAIADDPSSLNPVLTSEAVAAYIGNFIFSPLVNYDENLEIVPDLAESWEISDDGTRIILKLKKGIKWHDGVEMTASDCVFTFNKLLDPDTNTFNAGLFKVNNENITFKAIDRYTLEARLPAPFAPFFNNLTLISIIPEHILKDEDINRAPFNRNPIGTGAFRFREWRSSDSITLEANPDFHRGKPEISRIILKIIPSAEGRRIALLSGQVDVSGLTAECLFLMRRNMPEFIEVLRWESFVYFYFSYDLSNELFRDIRVRKAINYAIDNESIVKASLYDSGSPLHGPIPRSSWAYTGDVNKYEYNPEKAAELLEEAGWKVGPGGWRYKDGKKFSFQLTFKSQSQHSEAASIFIQSFLKDVGIEVKLQQLDLGALINSLYPGKYQSVVFNWVEPFDPDIYTEWHSTQMDDDGMNFMSYSNKEVDKLLEEARSTFDKKKRTELYHEIQKLIAEDAAYVFLGNEDAHVGVNKRLKGLPPPSPAGIWVYPEKVWVEE